MRIAVFTPTRRPGGLDVTLAALKTQERDDILWLIGDDRGRVLADYQGILSFKLQGFDSRKLSERPMSLCRAYNHAIRLAREWNAGLFVSLQDYTWIPPDGIAKFAQLAEWCPDKLLTGLCSHSKDPHPSEIHDKQGLFTIFNTPYDGHKPREIGWQDVRESEALRRYRHRGPIYDGIDVEWWEANWAAIPRQILHDERLSFNEEYDRAVGHENQDYALHAEALGYGRVLDVSNHAIALPHRAYFPEEAAELEVLREDNMRWHGERRATAR